MEDAQIVGLFWERSESGITELAAKYGGLCFRVAYNILENREDSEECVNDTYMSAWESIPPHKPLALSAFAAKLTRNNALNRRRFAARGKRGGGRADVLISELGECVPSADTAEERFDEAYAAAIIGGYLRSVSETKAAIFVHRYFFCCPVEELSARTGYSTAKITSMLFRMRKELRSRLEKGGVEF